MVTRWITTLALVLLCFAAAPLWADDIIPTNVWTAFGSTNTTINGLPIPVGAIIDAYDNDGVHCGRQFAGEVAGKYRFMSVYGDDVETPGVDEGCVYGEPVNFEINGLPATKLGPDSDLWVAGATRIMDLEVFQTFGLDLSGPLSGSANPGQSASYHIVVANTGDGIDSANLVLTSHLGWSLNLPGSFGSYIFPGVPLEFDVIVQVPDLTPVGTKDTLTIIGVSAFDTDVADTIKIVTTAGGVSGLRVSGPDEGQGEPGETVRYPILIENLGNEDDTVDVEVTSSAGWQILDAPGLDNPIGPFGSLPVDLGLVIPATAPIATADTLKIRVTSQTSRGASDSLTIITTVGYSYGWTINGPTYRVTDPGEAVEYTPVTIQNVGVLAEQPDLQWVSSSGYTIDGPTVPIAEMTPGESKDLSFTVNVPGDAPIGHRDTLQVVVASQFDPDKTDTLRIVTLIGRIYGTRVTGPAGDKGQPGADVHYQVGIENIGNVADSIRVDVFNSTGWSLSGLPDPVVYYDDYSGDLFDIVVSIPSSATIGDEDVLTIVATSKSDPGKFDTLEIVTTVDELSAVDDGEYILPGAFQLYQNYPNPFNMDTVIPFRLDSSGETTLEIYDILGHKVKTIDAGYLTVGEHQVRWNGSSDDASVVASGVYFYRLVTSAGSVTRKLMLLK